MSSISFVKPNQTSSLATWLAYIEQLYPKTIDLGLERVATVAKKCALTKPAKFVFLVAGTNGKGTTCRALEMILIEAGYKVGVYSSPHILCYTERVRIQNQELSKQEHVASLAFIENERDNHPLTYFEFCTLSAFNLFRTHHVDVAVIEVGLGGRLDATNIVDPDVSVITSIGLDHISWLGDTRELIGFEKAGILREHQLAVVGDPDMPQSIKDVAEKLACQKVFCSPNEDAIWRYEAHEEDWDFYYKEEQLSQLIYPKIPVQNAATALAALMCSDLTVSENHIRTGFAKTSLWGRLQTIQDNPQVILDVAHNAHAANYLSSQLKRLRKGKKCVRAVVGMLADKDIQQTFANMHNDIDVWYVASLNSARGAKKETLMQYLHNQRAFAFDDIVFAFEQALKDADKDDLIIVFGSFVTVGAILEHIQDGKK